VLDRHQFIFRTNCWVGYVDGVVFLDVLHLVHDDGIRPSKKLTVSRLTASQQFLRAEQILGRGVAAF
jgi:hypothetical protein